MQVPLAIASVLFRMQMFDVTWRLVLDSKSPESSSRVQTHCLADNVSVFITGLALCSPAVQCYRHEACFVLLLSAQRSILDHHEGGGFSCDLSHFQTWSERDAVEASQKMWIIRGSAHVSQVNSHSCNCISGIQVARHSRCEDQ